MTSKKENSRQQHAEKILQKIRSSCFLESNVNTAISDSLAMAK